MLVEAGAHVWGLGHLDTMLDEERDRRRQIVRLVEEIKKIRIMSIFGNLSSSDKKYMLNHMMQRTLDSCTDEFKREKDK